MRTTDLDRWPHLKGVDLHTLDETEVWLMIGVDVPNAFWSLEERRGSPGEPYAVKTMLGWSIVGPAGASFGQTLSVNYVRAMDTALEQSVRRLWQLEQLPSLLDTTHQMSKEDRYALSQMRKSKTIENGHYKVAVPWRPGSTSLPCNRPQVLSRLQQLKARLNLDPDVLEKYMHVVESYISQGHARKVELGDGSEKWMLPHHPVLHPLKPGKLRVVFDCAASYQGRSFNNELLTGPDLLQSLIDVLRFRLGRIAFTADI